MMMSEFIDRTGYEPSYEEYHHIEESYYEFDGNKDEFCKAWLKDKRDGHWDKELKLRMELEATQKAHKEQLDEIEETLNFYREQFDQKSALEKKLREATEKLERLERVFHRVFDDTKTA